MGNGKYKNLNGFDAYIRSILDNPQLMQKIRQTSSERYISFMKEKFRADREVATDCIGQEIARLQALREEEKEKAKLESYLFNTWFYEEDHRLASEMEKKSRKALTEIPKTN